MHSSLKLHVDFSYILHLLVHNFTHFCFYMYLIAYEFLGLLSNIPLTMIPKLGRKVIEY